MVGINVTVAIPVGPEKRHAAYLDEALESVYRQTVQPFLVIVDDMHGLPQGYGGARVWHAPWRLGVPAAFNAGVALAPSEFVLMMGADDTLEPDCIERVVGAIERVGEGACKRGMLYLPLRYMDTSEEQSLACNAAVVSKTLWRNTGGFAPETAVGACDTMFVTLLMAHPEAGEIYPVGGKPLYNYRRHAETDTASRGAWQGLIFTARDLLAREWKQPNWGRYA